METIGIYHCPISGKFGVPRQSGLAPSVSGKIVLSPPYDNPEALRGLEGFSHIWLIWGFNQNKREPLSHKADKTAVWSPTVRPPRLGGNTRVGVFASRSPFRPNSMGLSCVKVESIVTTGGKCTICVSGADLCDGTPIYDIKPYIPYADCIPDATGGFTDEKEWHALEVEFPSSLKEKFSSLANVPKGKALDDIPALTETLRLDPRPHYQSDPEREYGMTFDGVDVRFKVDGNTLTVTDILKREDNTQNDTK